MGAKKPNAKPVRYINAMCGSSIGNVRKYHINRAKRGAKAQEGMIYALDINTELTKEEHALAKRGRNPRPKRIFVEDELLRHLMELKEQGRKVKVLEIVLPFSSYIHENALEFWQKVRSCLAEKGRIYITTEVRPNEALFYPKRAISVFELAGFKIEKIIEDYKPANPTEWEIKMRKKGPGLYRIVARVS